MTGGFAAALVALTATVALAAFTDGQAVIGNAVTTDSIAPPAGLVVPTACSTGLTPQFESAEPNALLSGGILDLATPPGTQVGDLLVAGLTWDGESRVSSARGCRA